MWQARKMISSADPVAITRSRVEQLTIEAMVLADEAETYFAGEDALDGADQSRVAFAAEAFRSMFVLRQALDYLARCDELDPASPPFEGSLADLTDGHALPARARAIVAATRALCERVADLRPRLPLPVPVLASPARQLQARLVASLAG